MKTAQKRRSLSPEHIARVIVDHRLTEIRATVSDALGELQPTEAPYSSQDLVEAVTRQFGGNLSANAAHMEAGYILGVQMGARIGGAR